MTSTVAGVKFSDQLAALLDHAVAHGFRAEPDTRKRARGGIVMYAPDKDVSPITVTEIRSKLNPAHYDNIRRELYRAGCPPMPGDDRTDTPSEEDTMPAHTHVHAHNLDAELTGEDRASVLAGIVEGLFDRAELSGFSGFAASLAYATATFADEASLALGTAAVAQARTEMQKEIDEALGLASSTEERANRLEAQLAKAEEREAKARKDCGAAIERAKVAEAKAAELESAIAPLRSLLGKTA